ncbi:EthD domain-containing protein [Argonema antarcticum]|uniref:EthD domain-containing protein n=1 Tax=Argonema antarcticum TaxID=2942763 RepID=UPI00201235E3|nr:EthD domain-containing protein [Argonema antarcticum]MCL1470593.1 EthD domain-containing protein [Argonema antarcticum A004/B2]
MTENKEYQNAVLDDQELQAGLKGVNLKFGDFVTRVAGEAWGQPFISQKAKALITIAVDIVNQNQKGTVNPLRSHIDMALKQGATRAEIEELLFFLSAYTGFNKVGAASGLVKEFFEETSVPQSKTPVRQVDYASRDEKGKVAFYVLLWKRKGITLELFDNYWKDVHGPVCARLPGQHQYWQFHLAHNQGGIWPQSNSVNYITAEEDQFDGIAELTFETEQDRQTWFKAAAILMDDEHNLFSKAIGYNSSPGNSKTYVDGIPTGDPNGEVGVLKFHVLVRKADRATVEEFQSYMKNSFAPAVVQNESVLKFRLHIFDEVDNSRPEAAGVVHHEPPQKQYQAAFEIAFSNPLEMEKFFASKEYATAIKDQAEYVKDISPFPERTSHTFVYDSKITLAGQRSSRVAELILNIGATNQLRDDVVSMMSGNQNSKKSLGHYLQGVQHFGITVDNMAKAIEFYTEVLGGKIAISGDGFIGPVVHNTLFQKEDIEAIQRGIDPRELGVADLRDGTKEALDVRFISFGNTVIEVIHFRDAKLNVNAPNVYQKVPSCVGFANVPHISFHVKDDVDLNMFAKILEEECQSRGMTGVICNRIIHVNSEEERRKVALKYYANKFWNEPEYFIEGYSDAEFGDFHGWSLFYCKGPNGEQLEFNQVTRKANQMFRRAQKEYNEAHGTSFPWASDTITKPTSAWLGSHTIKEPTIATQEKAMTSERFPGQLTQIVKEMFKAGESMNVDNFVKFYTDDALYQFSNFPIVYGPKGIKDASTAFIQTVEALYHKIKHIWEVGADTVICEMEVTYIRFDGKVFTLPCCDTIRFKGDKVSELRIYMDISPVFMS